MVYFYKKEKEKKKRIADDGEFFYSKKTNIDKSKRFVIEMNNK